MLEIFGGHGRFRLFWLRLWIEVRNRTNDLFCFYGEWIQAKFDNRYAHLNKTFITYSIAQFWYLSLVALDSFSLLI